MKINRQKLMVISAIQALVLSGSGLIISLFGIIKFGATLWGEYIKIQLWLTPILLLTNWGSRNYLVQQFSITPSKVGSIFLENLVSRALLLPVAILVLFKVFDLNVVWFTIPILLLQYLYMSYDAVTVFSERHKGRILAEVLGLCVFLIGGLLLDGFSLKYILIIQLVGVISKLTYLGWYLKGLSLFKSSVQMSIRKTLTAGFPFMIIGISGLIQSKSDIYMLSYLSSSENVASYQMLTGGLFVIQGTIAFLIDPLVKVIYRTKEVVFRKVRRVIMMIGVAIIFPGLFSLAVGLSYLLPEKFNMYTYAIAFLYLLPFIFYYPFILRLYKDNKHLLVAFISVMGGAVNAIASFLLIPSYDLNGAILGTALSQFLILPLLVYFTRNSR